MKLDITNKNKIKMAFYLKILKLSTNKQLLIEVENFIYLYFVLF